MSYGKSLADACRIGASLCAFSAFDAFALVYNSMVVNNIDGIFGTCVLASMEHTAAAGRGNIDTIGWAFVTSGIHYLYGVFVVLVATHSHLDSVLHDGTFLVDAATYRGLGAWSDNLGYLKVSVLKTSFIGSAYHFFQYLIFDVLNRCVE